MKKGCALCGFCGCQLQVQACRTTTTITGIRIRMSALTYALNYRSANRAISAKKDFTIKAHW